LLKIRKMAGGAADPTAAGDDGDATAPKTPAKTPKKTPSKKAVSEKSGTGSKRKAAAAPNGAEPNEDDDEGTPSKKKVKTEKLEDEDGDHMI
jgi:hypothetical protein